MIFDDPTPTLSFNEAKPANAGKFDAEPQPPYSIPDLIWRHACEAGGTTGRLPSPLTLISTSAGLG